MRLAICLFLLPALSAAQPTFFKTVRVDTNYVYGWRIAYAGGEDIAVACTAHDSRGPGATSAAMVAKFHGDALTWIRRLEPDDQTFYTYLSTTPDSQLLLSGTRFEHFGTDTARFYGFFARLRTDSGAVEWARELELPGSSFMRAATVSDGFVLWGSYGEPGHRREGFNPPYLIKAGPDGTYRWGLSFPGSTVSILNVWEDPGTRELHVLGADIRSEYKCLHAVVAPDGRIVRANTIRQVFFGGVPPRFGRAPDGGYFLVTQQEGSSQRDLRLTVSRLDATDTPVWTYDYFCPRRFMLSGITPTPDGGLLLAGYQAARPPADSSPAMLLRLDAGGKPGWAVAYGDRESRFSELVLRDDATFYVVGSKELPAPGAGALRSAAIVVKARATTDLSPDGNIEAVQLTRKKSYLEVEKIELPARAFGALRPYKLVLTGVEVKRK